MYQASAKAGSIPVATCSAASRRTRRWLVEDERGVGTGLTALRLACIDDDAQGETVELLWDAELDGSILRGEGWAAVAKNGTDDPSVFSAYLRTLRWNTATAATR